MRNNISYRVTTSGLLVALGLLLPFATAHAFGVPGNIFLPMHIPVFLNGLLCGPMYGALGGIIIPILSSVLTGMPSFFPMLPLMVGELFTYGLVSGLLYSKFKLPLYPSLILSMLLGRLIYGLIFHIIFFNNNEALRSFSIVEPFIKGLPGIIIQLILIPPIVHSVKKHFTGHQIIEPTIFAEKKAKKLINNKKASCIIIKNNKIIRTENSHGINSLILIYENEPQILKDSFVVDKIIGKAAAMIIVLSGAKKVYGKSMSTAAFDYLEKHGCKADYGEKIDVISNRAGNGICPLENAVLDIDDPETGYQILKETINRLRSVC